MEDAQVDGLGRLPLGAPGDDSASRSSLHRYLRRHGISRLPEVEGDQPTKRKFMSYPTGCFHIAVAEVRTKGGELYLFVAIDRTLKIAFVELHEKTARRVADYFLRHLAVTLPNKTYTLFTDSGTHYTDPTGDGSTLEDIKVMRAQKLPVWYHAF